MINKKGISPLIATVLIIGFTVALAAVIMVWGSDFIKSTTDDVDRTTKVQIACTNADFKVLSCKKAAGEVSIENIGAISLKFKVRDFANKIGSVSNEIKSLEIGEAKCADGACGDSITVFPVVTIDGVESDCTQAGKQAVCS
ncbi:hypothetical protein J4468_03075 [Candidatus Woesearchaeota archaeon]|nr:hypothetical protein [Candidatus Woesearchaeota archaeon]